MKATLLSCVTLAFWLTCWPPPSAHGQADERKEVVARHIGPLFKEPLAEAMTKTSFSEIAIDAREKFETTVRDTFNELRRRDLMDEKLTMYEAYWKVTPGRPGALVVQI